jgi:hydroxymethylglutaryl-CoA synthase
MPVPFVHGTETRPRNVGIHAMDVYFPKTSVAQSDLEDYSGVPKGKFTIGLGQQNMAFCTELEDINSIMMTAVQNLLEKYDIDPTDVGRLEVGTETLIDKSKSVKSSLMQLFPHNDIEGIDSINACYGGTAALLNSLAWIESSAYDGRYAVVVCGDIAIYEEGPARPTGGCAAVAMLLGPEAPLHFSPSLRTSHMENAYDFYKPHLDSEYPVVFGHDSNVCYLRALDNCYQGYADKYEKSEGRPFNLNEVDHVIFHSPYNKLVKKSGARMVLNDYVRDQQLDVFKQEEDEIASIVDGKELNATYQDREIEKKFIGLARPMYEDKVEPSTLLPRELGNSYTAACYTGLLSLIDSWHNGDKKHVEKNKKSVLMFSYGSGLASTLFSLVRTGDTSKIAEKANLSERLNQRVFKTPEEFSSSLLQREKRYNTVDYIPSGNPKHDLFPGTFYLAGNDEFGRRKYARTPTIQESADVVSVAVAAKAAGAASSQRRNSLRSFSTMVLRATKMMRRL